MKQLRNKLGQFARPDGTRYIRKPFNQRYIKASDVQQMIDDAVKKAGGSVKSEELKELLSNAFRDGFDARKNLKATITCREALNAWKELNKF